MSTYRIFIGSDPVEVDNFTIDNVVNGQATCTFDVDSWDGTSRPSINAPVTVFDYGGAEVYYPGDIVFRGTITMTTEKGKAGLLGMPQITTSVTAADYKGYADRRFVKTVIPAGNLKSFLTVLANYLPAGFTLDPSQPDDSFSLEAQTLDYVQLSTILNQLTTLTGWFWDIAAPPNYYLSMFDPGGLSAPFGVVDGDGHAIGDMEVSPTMDKYANRIIVQFSSSAATAYGFFQITGNFSDGETVTLGDTQYTFADPFVDSANNVSIGGDRFDSLNRLISAITLEEGGAGSTYGTGTVLNSSATAYNLGGDVMKAIANTPGEAGNNIPVGTTASGGEWYGEGHIGLSTLELGADQSLANVTQSPLASAEPSSDQTTYGIWERVIQAPDIISIGPAQALADAYLIEHSFIPKIVKYHTYQKGLRPGMTQTITAARRNINNTFTVTDMHTTVNDSDRLDHEVTAIEGAVYQGNWRDVYKDWGGQNATGGGGSIIGGGGGVGGATVINKPVYGLGGSNTEFVNTPASETYYTATANAIYIDTAVLGRMTATVYARLRGRTTGVNITVRLQNLSDNTTAGTSNTIAQPSISGTPDWTGVIFNVALTAGAKYYGLQIKSNTAGEDVAVVAYME